MDDQMNAWEAKMMRENQLWSESRLKEYQLVDEVLTPWVKQRMQEGTPTDELLNHPAADGLLNAVDGWCLEYRRWRAETGLEFIQGYPVEEWAGYITPERRSATLFRVANYYESEKEPERAAKLRQWALNSLLEHLNDETGGMARET